MRIDIGRCSIDEFSLGIFSATGVDESGEFFMISLGFLLFTIDFIKYK